MRPTHDDYYCGMLHNLSARSTCARRAVGAIIVNGSWQILSTGYNGVPSSFPHCSDAPCDGANDPPGDTRRCEAVHAEINALLQCQSISEARTLYVSCTPCFTCTKAILNTPITRIVCLEEYADQLGREMLDTKGVEVIVRKALKK